MKIVKRIIAVAITVVVNYGVFGQCYCDYEYGADLTLNRLGVYSITATSFDLYKNINLNGSLNLENHNLTMSYGKISMIAPYGDGLTIFGGGNGIKIEVPGKSGIEISNPQLSGIKISKPGVFGIDIDATSKTGINLIATNGTGLIINALNGKGMLLNSSNYDGLDLTVANAKGINMNITKGNGINMQLDGGIGMNTVMPTGTGINLNITKGTGANIQVDYGVALKSTTISGISIQSKSGNNGTSGFFIGGKFIVQANGYTTPTIIANSVGKFGIRTSDLSLYDVAIKGYVGIDGKVECDELEVKLVDLADFVFAKNYKLMSLEKVEKFIQENNHLPDVPSAEEVASEGLNVGQFQNLLLQKIEELTLYMIELKKENDKLKAEIEIMKK